MINLKDYTTDEGVTDLTNMIKDEIKDQVAHPEEYNKLIEDSTSKYRVIPNLIKEWQVNKKSSVELGLNTIAIEVNVFLIRKLLKIDRIKTIMDLKNLPEEFSKNLSKYLNTK